MPEPMVTKPKTSSPLMGLQQRASLYWIFEMSSSIISASLLRAGAASRAAAFARSTSAAAARRYSSAAPEMWRVRISLMEARSTFCVAMRP